MQQPPGHCSDLVEESESGVGSWDIDRTCREEETEAGVDFLGGSVQVRIFTQLAGVSIENV
jgi:hypothetical protein